MGLNGEIAFSGVVWQEEVPYYSSPQQYHCCECFCADNGLHRRDRRESCLALFHLVCSFQSCLKKKTKQLTNIGSSVLFFTPNGLFSMYQLLHMQSFLWHSLPIHCSTAKWGCVITAISTARISQNFKKKLMEAAATNLARWNNKYFALFSMHIYWSKVVLRWERGKVKILLPAACRGLGKALSCLWSCAHLSIKLLHYSYIPLITILQCC